MNPLRFSWGSVMGAEHLKLKKNCQDALAKAQTKDYFVAFVSDGGSNSDLDYETFTEVGSRLAVKTLVSFVTERLDNTSRWRWNTYLQSTSFWRSAQTHLLTQIDEQARGMGGLFQKNIIDYFLFTLVGMVITPEITLFAGVGDGYYFLNGIKYDMRPGGDNRPPYIAYNLIETSLKKMSPQDLRLGVRKIVSSSTVSSAMIASDGLTPLVINDGRPDDGTKRKDMGPVSQFWTNKEFFDNTFSLGWKLKELASEKRTIVWKEERVEIRPPAVTDDLALVVASRI